MSGWFGYAPSGDSGASSDPGYDRVTNPERFLPLHHAMSEIIDRLESDFEVRRVDEYGLDEDLEKGLDLATPSVKLSPQNPDAAPITVVFTTFPSLNVRFGRWYNEPFPDCGCDACDESAEGEIERLNEMVDDLTSGRFRESIHLASCGCQTCREDSRRGIEPIRDSAFGIPVGGLGKAGHRPPMPFLGDGWRQTEFWAPSEDSSTRLSTRSLGRSRINGVLARGLTDGHRRLTLNWQPWRHR